MSANRTRTPEAVKAEFRANGMTVSAWAERRGYRRSDVYKVLNGLARGHRGTMHRIAVDLGLKAEVAS